MANTLKMGERTPSKNISQIISMNINVMTTILGLFLSLHASAHQEADWGHVFLSFDRFERCHGSGDLEELVDGMTSGAAGLSPAGWQKAVPHHPLLALVTRDLKLTKLKSNSNRAISPTQST